MAVTVAVVAEVLAEVSLLQIERIRIPRRFAASQF